MSAYSALWIAWILAFVAIEAKALQDGRAGRSGGTLSEHLRAWLGTRSSSTRAHRIVGSAALLLAVAWFVPHILGG